MTKTFSYQIIFSEWSETSKKMAFASLEPIFDIANQIIIVDNNSSKDIRDSFKSFVEEHYSGELNYIIRDKHETFAELRNIALEYTNPTIDYVVWFDTDEIYYPETKKMLRSLVNEFDLQSSDRNPSHALQTRFYHFNKYPTHLDPDCSQLRGNIIKNHSALRWTGDVHERIFALGKEVSKIYSGIIPMYAHYGYCKHSFEKFTHWLHYDLLEHGHLDCYMGDYFKDKTPNTIIDDRLSRCKPFDKEHPEPFKKYLSNDWKVKYPELTWDEYILKTDIPAQQLWSFWQGLKNHYGNWNSTLHDICKYFNWV